MSLSHVLAVPYPAQGHVIPMMELSRKLVQHGCKVTFVNTDFIHRRVTNALSSKEDDMEDGIELVSIPDGLELGDDRFNLGKLMESMLTLMPGKLEELIQNAKNDDNTRFSCVVAEGGTGWALEVAKKMGLKTVAFCPVSASTAVVASSIPNLIENGFIDSEDGTILKKQFITISPTMPAISTEAFAWACFADMGTRKSLFKLTAKSNDFIRKFADFIICNSANELEPAAFAVLPKLLPVGPLFASSRLGNQGGNFWPKDSDCLSWLDQQPPSSVIYVAFGSFTAFNQTQFQELALGLELTNKPFLWVARPGITFKETNEGDYPQGYKERIGSRGKIVSWAPQEKVLRHPSVACFLSHCGWNSITEGVSNGIPFLCWPYFADQYLNESYICNVWKIGLRFEKDESGIIRQGEIKNKVNQILGNKNYKAIVMDLKEKIINSVQNGCSYKNLGNVIQWIRDT
ncbi:UDP-glycosyltransferase 83A1-like [Apium graveolens]|uniref:UDP-glycosyltransferase 83A1-like n=1 Tax=Apium graveolens TaxID=4045 RepID=UPI003D78E1FE